MTRRNALSAAGTLLWEVRVRGLQLGRFPGLRKIFSSASGSAQDWEEEYAVPEACLEEIQRLCELRAGRSWTPIHVERKAPEQIVLAATDATPRSIAYVILQPFRCVHAEVMPEGDMAWMELKAILELWKEVGGDSEVELRLLTDSAIAAAVLEKGYSRSSELDELVQQIYSRQGTIRVTWLPSESNVADTPSRRVLNKLCERCGNWQQRDYAGDSLCSCGRKAVWSANFVNELDPEREELTCKVVALAGWK